MLFSDPIPVRMAQEQPINPAMIALARESRGWTQKDLATLLGVHQATVCKWETSQRVPSPEELGALVRETGFRSSFFRQTDTVYGLGSTFLFHRQRARIPLKIQSRVQAEINIRRMQAQRLLRGTSWEHDHLFPSLPSGAYEGKVEAVAQEVRRLWNLPPGPVQNVTKVIENAGGIVIKMDFHTPLIDGVHLWAPGHPPMFFMNSQVSGERERYNLAHEIGHAVMHHGNVAVDEPEKEANRFAAAFLMPRADIRRDLSGLTLERASKLKPFWKVSMQALIYRAKELDQISESAYRRMYTSLSARGDRIEEPWALPNESPEVLDRMTSFHRNHLGMTDEEIGELLFADRLGPMDLSQRPRLRLAEDSLFD